jgi:hypothetical protein
MEERNFCGGWRWGREMQGRCSYGGEEFLWGMEMGKGDAGEIEEDVGGGGRSAFHTVGHLSETYTVEYRKQPQQYNKIYMHVIQHIQWSMHRCQVVTLGCIGPEIINAFSGLANAILADYFS